MRSAEEREWRGRRKQATRTERQEERESERKGGRGRHRESGGMAKKERSWRGPNML
mgnify:CR=1 FL=1